jgi:hypothetical protein
MNEKLCFVQFLHPGGEHGFDEPGLKHWNRDAHKRKFLRSPGRVVFADGDARAEEVVFWGEWEPPSRVTEVERPVPHGPRWVHEPFLPGERPTGWRQNTDPFVFGDFHYTGCLQHTKFGPTQLRYLARGSVVLFGSCIGGSSFALDTVLVVDRWIDHTRFDYEDTGHNVSSTYYETTVLPWYDGANVNPERSHRLYFGAWYEQPLEGMFSFVPGRMADDALGGFARPIIDIAQIITPTQSQGKRLNPQPSLEAVKRYWTRVVNQVEKARLSLVVHVEPPPVASAVDRGLPSGRAGC